MKVWGITWKTLLVGLVAAFCGILAFAQAGQGSGPGSRIYDPKTETTIKGVIQEVREVPGPGQGMGTHLIVKTGQNTIEVHVGPSWYLREQKCEFKKDAEIEILGSKVNLQGTDVLVARQIKDGSNTCTLRDPQGVPAWSGGKNR